MSHPHNELRKEDIEGDYSFDEKEITRMCKLKRPGQAFLVGNGESQLYWKLREKSGR